MPKGRPASLPPAGGHQRPAVLVGLVVTHIDEKGTKAASYDFSTLPLAAQFQLELATVFAARTNPTGQWRNLPTSKEGFWTILFFARWLAKQDRVPTSVADLDAATWSRWRLAQTSGTTAGLKAVRLTRMFLLDSGLLSPKTRGVVSKRIPRNKPQESSYSDDELLEVRVAAHRVWRTARDRIRRNLNHLYCYRAGDFEPGTEDHLLGMALEHIAMEGDVPRNNGRNPAPAAWVTRALGGGHRNQTWKRLYLDDGEVTAVLVLLACKEGWNETSIRELEVPERVDGGSATPVYRVELEKRRRRPPHRYETRTLTDSAPDTTARLLGHILEVTQPARNVLRAHGHPTNRLLISHSTCATGAQVRDMFVEGLGSHSRDSFANASGRTVNLRRIRKAVNNRHRRQPNQNSRETHESIYLLRDPHTFRESEALIARGIERAIAHAETVEAAVKPDNSDMGDDTPTATCTDAEKSPYSPWGVACAASFLLCLACQNAVVMPKHLGRLAYLYQSLTNRRASLPPDVWQDEWAAHYCRLHSLRTEHYTEGQWQQALDNVTDNDVALVTHLLKGDLDA